MFANFKVYPMIAVIDIERARRWYAEKLGLQPTRDVEGELIYQLENGTGFGLYQTPAAGTAKNTVAVWDVDDLDAVMAAMRARGVVFEEYDFPGLKTVNGVVSFGDTRGAWFKDSEGNILALNEWIT